MKDLNKEELAWAAGFFDGEGTTTTKWNKQSPRLNLIVTLSNTDLELLMRFRKAIMQIGTIHGPYIKGIKRINHKPIWNWQVQHFEGAQAVVGLLWKYLGRAKQQQAKEALKRYHESRIGFTYQYHNPRKNHAGL